jgi:hypothetical protein
VSQYKDRLCNNKKPKHRQASEDRGKQQESIQDNGIQLSAIKLGKHDGSNRLSREIASHHNNKPFHECALQTIRSSSNLQAQTGVEEAAKVGNLAREIIQPAFDAGVAAANGPGL